MTMLGQDIYPRTFKAASFREHSPRTALAVPFHVEIAGNGADVDVDSAGLLYIARL
jgi:hypothetical protein